MEKRLQSKIIQWLKSQGGYVIKAQAGPGVPVGCPDIICLYRERWCVIEVKADEHARMQPGQQATLDWLGGQNMHVYKAWPDNWLEVKSLLQRHFF
jgi:Holliday junction resolvase-like predicted endonuclease